MSERGHSSEGIVVRQSGEARYDDQVPQKLKWTMTFINRVGFPIVAFAMMYYLCFNTLKEQSKAIGELKEIFVAMRGSIDKNTEQIGRMTESIYRARSRRSNNDE